MPEDGVEVRHRLVQVALLGVQEGAVEIGQGIGGVQFDSLVHVLDGGLVVALLREQAATPDVAFGLETVDLDRLVVVVHCLEGVAQEKVGGAAVQVGRRVLGLLADVFVKVLDGRFELLAEEVGHAAGEIQAGRSGAEFDGLFQVLQGIVVVAEAAGRDGAVVVAGGEDWVQADSGVEVRPCAADVAQVVLGDAAVEERPVVGRVQLREDVELGHRLRQAPFCQGITAPEHEDVLVILRLRPEGAGKQDKQADQQFSLALHPEKFSNDGRNG